MNSVTELKEAVLADYIMRIRRLPREKLEQELIEIKSRELLDDKPKLKNNHGKQTTKN